MGVLVNRIIVILLRLFLKVPAYLCGIRRRGRQKNYSVENAYAYIKKITKDVNRVGRIKVEAYGEENIPKENGFVFFPNHQGLFDGLVFLDSCSAPFSFIIKKEVSNVIVIKQVLKALRSIPIDRGDIRQSMQVINQVAEEVKKGRNFLIFPEGTRSKQGNKLLDFKSGAFKSAVKAKCPIVPCALIDSFKPFDESSVKPVTVKLFYLPPLYYKEYMGMKTVEIAALVKRRIEETIAEQETA
jgi:1-acyl-sn-glycerol-3-phosphate acyltransferase